MDSGTPAISRLRHASESVPFRASSMAASLYADHSPAFVSNAPIPTSNARESFEIVSRLTFSTPRLVSLTANPQMKINL